MRKLDMNQLSGDIVLYRHKDYVFFLGRKLHVFTTQGEFLFTGEGVRVPHQVVFIRPDLMLLEAGGWYYLMDMPSGNIRWKTSCPKGQNTWGKIRISPDGKRAYQKSDAIRSNQCRLTITDLETGAVTQTPPLTRRLQGAIRDFCFDETGRLCFLETRANSGPELTYWAGIAYEDGWKVEPWASSSPIWPVQFWQDANTLLTGHYQLYHVDGGTVIDLASNAEGELRKNMRRAFYYTPDDIGHYLMDHRGNGTVVIDMEAHRIAAQYAEPGYGGIIVGDECWFVSRKPGGCLVRKPFPAFEELPPKQLPTLGIIPPRDRW